MVENQAPVLWSVEDGVGHIVLNRSRAPNASSEDAARAFAEVVAQAVRADVGAILLSSTGKQFSAGATSTCSQPGSTISTS